MIEIKNQSLSVIHSEGMSVNGCIADFHHDQLSGNTRAHFLLPHQRFIIYRSCFKYLNTYIIKIDSLNDHAMRQPFKKQL